MPARREILFQIKDLESQGSDRPYDAIRRHYMNKLNSYTGRDLILYSSQSLAIDNSDVQGFMEAIHGLESDELDLILHSSGGSPVAAEQIVAYVRSKFDDIRIFVPQAAMSAATLICCASDEVIMGHHSSLGPIDPQITIQTNMGRKMAPAHAILDQFNKASGEIKSSSDLLSWLPILEQYPPGMLAECEDAIDLSYRLAKEWAEDYMHSNNDDREELARQMANYLSDRSHFKSHGRRISRDKAKENGFVVSALEDDDKEQDLVLSIFHATMHAHQNKPLKKIIENQNGRNVMQV